MVPLDFIYGTDIVDRGLIVLFFGRFFAIFCIFSVAPSPPPWKFSADALISIT